MTIRPVVPILAACALATPLLGSAADRLGSARDEAAVQEVVETSYVQGLHALRDEAVVRAGFHPDFVMTVNGGDGVVVVTLDEWLARLELDGEPSPRRIESRFERVDVSGQAASVRVEILADGEHLYTDYFGLYELEDGWKIVNKIFHSHS